jgi:AraC-like DNA-binding protein
MRHDGRAQGCDGTGLLLVPPGEVCVVERLTGDQPRPGERTLFTMAVPIPAIDPELWAQYERKVRCGTLQDPRPARALRFLCQAMEQRDFPDMRVEELLQGLLLCCLQASAAVTPREKRLCARALRRARDFIHANWRQPFSLATLAEASGVTKWHLTRTFTSALGVTPSEYARVIRAQHALTALRAGEIPARIASDLGYSDQAHLTREIHRLYGFTPAAYRNAAA